MTREEAVNWIINITADMGKVEHRDLWHYEQALSEIREMLEQPERKKGKWILTDFSDEDTYMCSVCMVFFVFLFCVLNKSLKIFFHCPKIALLKFNMHMNYTGNLLNC